MPSAEPRREYLLPGKNALETCIILSEVHSDLFRGRKKTMEREAIKEVLRRLNEAGVRYAIIGGVACGHHALPRATQDLDLIVLAEDAGRVRQIFPGCYLGATAMASLYEFKGLRFDVQPARLRVQIAVVGDAVDGMIDEVPVKVASLRHLILLKLWAAAERPELGKKAQDQTDVIRLLEYNADRISAEDMADIARSLLALGYTAEEAAKYRQSLVWLNGILEELGMSDRTYPLEPCQERRCCK
jgi:predicted nucleotidyltransferase